MVPVTAQPAVVAQALVAVWSVAVAGLVGACHRRCKTAYLVVLRLHI